MKFKDIARAVESMLGGRKRALSEGNDFTPKEFSKDEERRIQEKLNLKLGPEYVSYRPAPGGVRVAYVEGWAMLNLANDIFGFNGWSSSIVDTTIDEENGRVCVGISCTIRVYLKDGTFHEDIGYGSSDNQRSKAAAYEKAKKEAVTDGIKRALRYFGNCLGNCTYDKEFLREIKGMSMPQKNPMQADQLLRANRSLDRAKSEMHTKPLIETKEVVSDSEIYNENDEVLNSLFDEALLEPEIVKSVHSINVHSVAVNAKQMNVRPIVNNRPINSSISPQHGSNPQLSSNYILRKQ